VVAQTACPDDCFFFFAELDDALDKLRDLAAKPRHLLAVVNDDAHRKSRYEKALVWTPGPPSRLRSIPVLRDRKAVSFEVGEYFTHAPHRVRVPMLAELAAFGKPTVRIVPIKHQPPGMSA
jgi:hypothetical protein